MIDRRRLSIGLTGGIASGKTLVSDRLAEQGASVIDTDVVARDIVAVGSPGLAAVAERFGNDYIGPDGQLDRSRLRALVFRDPAERVALENITHPLIRERCLSLASRAEGTYLVFVVPLLVGSSFTSLVDRILVVDCAREAQLSRLMARDGETMDSATRILDAQSSRAARLAIADDVISNDADVAALLRKTDALHRFYLQLASEKSAAAFIV